MAAVLSQDGFYDRIVNELSLDRSQFDPELSIWELGLDSALIVEVILLIEDLGVELPDDIPWERISLQELYRIYAVAVATDSTTSTS